MKKFVTMLLAALLAIGCMFALAACDTSGSSESGDTNSSSNSGDNSGDNSADEQIEYSVYGNFQYLDENGSDTDSYGASWRCWVDTGNKFHLYGTLPHDDGTTSTVEFEGQVTYINQYNLTCHQVMFFTFTYHGEENDDYFAGAQAVVSAYKEALAEDYGESTFTIVLNRTTNDTSETGYAGTFYAEYAAANIGWDLSEGVWDYVLGLEEV